MGKNKKKEDFHLPILSASLWYLSSLLSHILISLASIHPIGTHSPGVPTVWTQGQLRWTLSSLLLPSCFPLPFFWNITRSFVIDFLTCPDWYVFHGATSSFNSNIWIHHIRTTWFCVAMVETINWLGGFQHKTKKLKNRPKTVQAGGEAEGQRSLNSHARHTPTLNYRHYLGRSQKLRRQILQTGSSAAFGCSDLEEFSDPELK